MHNLKGRRRCLPMFFFRSSFEPNKIYTLYYAKREATTAEYFSKSTRPEDQGDLPSWLNRAREAGVRHGVHSSRTPTRQP